MRTFQAHLGRWMLAYLLVAMAAGLALGRAGVSWTNGHGDALQALTTVAVFCTIYPLMVNVRVDALAQAGRSVRAIGLALGYSFVWSPALGFALARLFLHQDPLLALGFLLVMTVPASSMSIGYTGIAEGNVELAAIVVAASFLVAVAAVPAWMAVFAAHYRVPIPAREMLTTVLEVLAGPIALGALTRTMLVRRLGRERFAGIQPLFPAVSLLSLFLVVGLIFFARAGMIISQWHLVVLLLAPNALYVGLTLGLQSFANPRLGLPYRDHMAVVFASSSCNVATAIAVATLAFSPSVALPAATMPLVQPALLVGYLKLAPRLRTRLFGSREDLTVSTR